MSSLGRRACPVVLAAPSGAGKATMARALVERHEDFVFSGSATTRPAREHEVDGVDYRFLSEHDFQAMIEAESVVISGEVKGDITARRKITLGKAARVTGDLRTPGIVIEEGAKLEGRIVIGPDEKVATRKAAPTRSTETPREAIAARGANSGSVGTSAS